MFCQYYITILIVCVKVINTCIPTQNVETVSTKSDISSSTAFEAVSNAATTTTTTSTTPTATTIINEITSTAPTSTTTISETPTTTTVTTTTTTTVISTTTTVYPCSVCPKIYNTACQGYQIPSSSNYCLTPDEVPIVYTLGPVASSGLPADTCSTQLSCPPGTVSRVNVIGTGYMNGNSDGSPTLIYCSESYGTWYADINGYMYYYAMDIACQYP